MIYCPNCNTQIAENEAFCHACGCPNPMMAPPIQPAMPRIELPLYEGQAVELPIPGGVVHVSPELDAFNFYRKTMRCYAIQQSNMLREEYYREIRDLDSFLTRFPHIYTKHRFPLLDAAMNNIVASGIYDLSFEQFEAQHTEDFCLCGEDVEIMVESFNATIDANRERKAQTYNMMPGIIFSGGIGAIAAAFAVNVAVNKIAEEDIKRADVTPRQRAELFARIDTGALIERAFTDYWRVFLSMIWEMRKRGAQIWYPTEENNRRAEGIYSNLVSGRLPYDRIPEMTSAVLAANPYTDGIGDFLRRGFVPTPEINAVLEYFEI